jgi:hypothetical protein
MQCLRNKNHAAAFNRREHEHHDHWQTNRQLHRRQSAGARLWTPLGGTR